MKRFYKTVNLSNMSISEIVFVFKEIEKLGYKHGQYDDFDILYTSTNDIFLFIYNNKMLNDPKVKAALLEYLI